MACYLSLFESFDKITDKNLSVSLSREISLVQPREIFRDSDVANLWRLKIWLERRGAFQLSVKLKKKRRVYAVFETSPVKSGWSQQGQYVSWQEKAVDGVIKWSDFGPDPHKFPHMFGVRCASLPNLQSNSKYMGLFQNQHNCLAKPSSPVYKAGFCGENTTNTAL